MTSLCKLYENIFNKHRFLVQDQRFMANRTHSNNSWQKQNKLNEIMAQLPENVNQYIAYLCTLYKRSGERELSINLEGTADFNPAIKKLCELYAIGLLVCDDLLTRINFLNINKKLARITVPVISYKNVCHYLTWMGNVLLKLLAENSQDFYLSPAEINMLNSYAKLLINAYNSSALGIFRKQPHRKFSNVQIAINA